MSDLQTEAGISWVPLAADWPRDLRGGVSTRRGGVSGGALATLNLGVRVGDRPAHRAANLARLTRAVGLDLSRAARVHLLHANRVTRVSEPGFAGDADAMVTTIPDLPLALTVADCYPLLLGVAERGVGLAHCGWRGILAGIVTQATSALLAATGAAPRELRAWIGPGIGPCCFGLPPRLAGRFEASHPPSPPMPDALTGDELVAIDLVAAIVTQLREAAVPAERISFAGHCTSCRSDLFYSYRRDGGRTGRMLAWIARAGSD